MLIGVSDITQVLCRFVERTCNCYHLCFVWKSFVPDLIIIRMKSIFIPELQMVAVVMVRRSPIIDNITLCLLQTHLSQSHELKYFKCPTNVIVH